MGDKLSEEQELEKFDQWMKTLPVQRVGEDFTATVIASAILMKKRSKSLKLMVLTICMLSGMLALSFLAEPTSIYELPDWQVPQIDASRYMQWLNSIGSVFSNPTVVMFCIVVEAILFLLIIDQIANYYRYIKKNVVNLNI